ncbi:glutamic acid-rich protein-like [Littorina saxatilis]|uniref:glutamic acid-rich protein-like n=1 Tax=Littorina saxatilis TaxID=31220 RepID=UPI0038B5F7B4
MSGLKITALEGLRTQGSDGADPWKDFYGDDKEKQQENGEQEKSTKTGNGATYEDDFEGSEEEGTETVQDKSEEMSIQNSHGKSENTETSQGRHDSTENLSQAESSKKSKKKKSKKPKTHHPNTKPPPLNLYQDHVRERLNNSRPRVRPSHDTMSDQEMGRRRGRKLNRRTQMKKYHSMEQAIEEAGRDRLEQKFEELEDLMARPLTDTRGVKIPHKRLQKMVTLHHQHGELGHGEVSSSRRRVGAWMEGTVQEEEGREESQAYSAIRVLQVAGPSVQMQVSYENGAQGRSPRNSRITAKPPMPRRRKGSVDSSPTSSSGASQHKNESGSDRKENGFHRYFSSDEEEGKDDDDTPRKVKQTDMHIKNSDNPKLKDWLKRKNAEHRRARKAERTKKREERNDKMVEQELKIARREKSSERVKQWMDVKRKEAARREKEERKRRKQDAQEEAKLRARSQSGVSGSGVGRPQSAPPRDTKKYIPVQRPDSAVEARSRLDPGDGSAPKPPDTKFVYKRPVSGRVRLMKLQSVRNSQVREAEQKRTEELTAEEKEQKARTSYDAWLLTKRKEDIEKRKESKRQKELAKSDPEMERIIPELAKRRIDRIKNGKKSIDTGISQIDRSANNSFGGGEFGEEGEGQQNGEQGQGQTPKPSSYNLEITGEGATLVELNSRSRPATAKARMPIPQKAFSPRRPQSAKARSKSPKVREVMDVDRSTEPNPFKLPFPDDKGCPDHIRRVQERIFSNDLTTQSDNDSERPEPQGCASMEIASCPKGVDASSKSNANPRASMALLQEIEAAAVQEAEQAALNAIKESGDASAEEAPAAGTDEGKEEPEQRAEEQVDNTEQKADGAMEAEEKTDDADDEQKEEEQEEKEAGEEEEMEEEEAEEEIEEEVQEEVQDQNEEVENQQEEQQEEKEGEEKDEDGRSERAGEGSNQEEEPEPESVTAEEQVVESHAEIAQAPDEGGAEEKSSSQPEDNENAGEDAAAEKEGQETEADDTPRRSLKRVSFSADLTEVFESVSVENSSNFEDERGDDETQGESEYVSLDDAPEP